VNANTASRLYCYGDYASGLMAPTSGTNTTFGRPRHAQDQSAGNGRPAPGAAITIAFSAGQKAAWDTGATVDR
jgi:hypothetical protein